tara:strand:+ start:1170 stop:1574 length:405 start_codon:yes stop_codon:yes gene_type:complete
MILILSILMLQFSAFALEIPTGPKPEGDTQFLLYIVFAFLAWISFLVHNVWISSKKKEAEKNKTDKQIIKQFENLLENRDDKVVSSLELFEVKFEGMISALKAGLHGDHKILEQRIDSTQKELTEFKLEVRGKQ